MKLKTIYQIDREQVRPRRVFRSRTRSEHAERTARNVARDAESSAMGDSPSRNVVGDRKGGHGAGAGAEVGGVPYLHVDVIGSGGAAKTAATVIHCSVHKKDTDGTTVTGNGYRSHLGEFERGRIE